MSSPRRLYRDGTVWEVREREAHGIPGARGNACLIFEAPERIRRVWVFPASWRELDDSALWHLAARSPLTTSEVDRLSQKLSSALFRAMENLTRAQALVAFARATMETTREQRNELLHLLQQWREARDRMRVIVQAHAVECRQAGVLRDEAALFVANAIRESAAPLGTDLEAVSELQRTAARWCAAVYNAA
jgi:hypothetical protein